MIDLNRRDFIKIAVGGAVLLNPAIGFSSTGNESSVDPFDIGECKSVKITCVSELKCFDLVKHYSVVKEAGGAKASQYDMNWSRISENNGGVIALIDLETTDGQHKKFLFDVGWGRDYTESQMKRNKIDQMLKNNEIEFAVISHEHLDHFFGLESVLKYNQNLKLYITDTFGPKGLALIKGAEFKKPDAVNRYPHKGELVQLKTGTANKLFDGCASFVFQTPPRVQVHGEQALVFNVKDKGVVIATGCCHPKINYLSEYIRNNLKGGENLYGIYGGLHIAPKEEKTPPKWVGVVEDMSKFGYKKVAVNHCTGKVAVKKMIDLGMPVVRGTASNGSLSDLYVGNGDTVVF